VPGRWERCALQYHVRFNSVEAQPVTLAGKPLIAFMAAGEMHLVSADTFRLFFQGYVEEGDEGTAPCSAPAAVVVRPVPLPSEPMATKKRSAGVGPVRVHKAPKAEVSDEPKGRPVAVSQILGITPTSVISCVMLAVKEAPRTTAEVADRVISIFPDAARSAIWGYVSKLMKEGQLEKRDDPQTQLAKLYVAGKKAAE